MGVTQFYLICIIKANMEANEAFKSLGIVSALVLFCGLWFVVKKWPQGNDRTFSQHIASSKAGVLFYIGLFSIVLPMLLLFFMGWFIPTYGLSSWFTFFILIAATTQFLCTLIPETGGNKSKCHRLLAFASADCLIPSVLILVMSETPSYVSRVISLVSLIIMSSIVFILVHNKAEHKNLLVLQASYFFAFFASVLSVTYL